MWSVAIKNTFVSLEFVQGDGHRRARSAGLMHRRDFLADDFNEINCKPDTRAFGSGMCETIGRISSDFRRCDSPSTCPSSIEAELNCCSSDDEEWTSIEEVQRMTIRREVIVGRSGPSPQRPTQYNGFERFDRVDPLAEFEARIEQEAITTVMIRNVPNRCSQRALMKELDNIGLSGTFDFVYVPLDLRRLSNVGYAFVNFLNSSDACRCARLLQGHRMRRQAKAGKEVAVSVAQVQGMEANLRHYEKSTTGKSRMRQRRPVILPNGLEL